MAFPIRTFFLAAALLMPQAAQAEDLFDPAQREEIGRIVRQYLLDNPEVLLEVSKELEARQQAAENSKRDGALTANARAIFDSPDDFVAGNPQGDVTLVEFFDYNCGYCKKALGDLSKLVKENPDLRIVLRDFPVLGPGSVEAARVAMATAKQVQGDKFWAFHQKLLGGRGQAGKEQALAAAREVGVDMGKLEKDMNGPDIRAGYAEVMNIADKLSLTGTPSWVVGKEVIVGAVGYDELNSKIANFRKCGKTACS